MWIDNLTLSTIDSSCIHDADNNPCDGCIDNGELKVSIDSWFDGNLGINTFFEVIELWKSGCE